MAAHEYDLDSNRDVAELRNDSFDLLLAVALVSAIGVSLIIAIVWAISWPINYNTPFPPEVQRAAPLWLSAAIVFLAYYLKRKRFTPAAKWTLIGALLFGPTLHIYLYGPASLALMFYILPIALTSVIIGRTALVWVTSITALLTLAATTLHLTGPLALRLIHALTQVWGALLIDLLVALITYLNSNIVFATVQWAIDAQRKDEKRTHLLQQQQQQLDRTILELKVAHSKLQHLNQELLQAKSVAEEANRLKTQFLANMSHELRTPLNAIINFTRFLSKERYGTLTQRQQELQQRVLANADHLLGLINDILDLSKIEAGRMDLIREPVDLHPLLQGVMATAVGLTKDKGLTLALHAPDQLPPVFIDKTRIRQVLLNLLSNAAKFTEQGGLSLHATPTPQGFVTIAVQDTGIGISPADQALVFEEFRQVQGELTRQYQGTGLGLPISKRLVEIHGGQMWLESTPGIGSTFSFTLPVVQPTAQASQADDQTASGDNGQSSTTVAVIDDDPDAQRILRDQLAAVGYNVCSITDSRQALQTIQHIQPQLVVLDLVMPQLNGWEILEQLRAHPQLSSIPVIICSMVDQRHLGIAMGANGYLLKPVREELLIELAQRWAPQAATVLVVDDDADARRVVRAILEPLQYRVVEASNGKEGLAQVQQVQPQLLLLDLMMPEMDGFELLAQLRDDPRFAELPVIVASAKELEEHERQWLLQRSQLCVAKHQLSAEQFVTYIRHFVAKGVTYGY